MAHSAGTTVAGMAQPSTGAPASGGKGGANNAGQPYRYDANPDAAPAAPADAAAPAAPAETQMNNPTAPNVMQQSAQGLTLANAATAAGTQYQPMNVQAQTVGQTDLSQYTNPFESQVVDQSLADLERARKTQQNVSDYQMGRAGAFGGSRHGIADAESNRNFYDRAGALASGLRQQGFTQAQNMAGQDANRMLQASMANQSTGLAGAGQRLQAAGQLGRLSQQGFDMGRTLTSDVREQGNMQQLMQQQLIDAAKQQFAGYTGAPASTIGYLSQALGASTIPQSQQTTKQNGIMDYLTMGTMLAGSDKRLKTNIKELGRLDNGLGVYSWDWTKDADEKGLSNSMRLGFIAQEVEEVMPENVVTMPSGYLAVNYGNIFEELA